MSRDLTRGRLVGHVLGLGPPAVVAHGLLVAFEVVDVWWVGRMEGEAGALAVGTYVLWSLFSMGQMVEAGTLAVCAQAVGGGRAERARRGGARGVVFAVMVGGLSLAALPGVGAVVDFTGVGEAARGPAGAYLRVLVCGAVSIYGFAAVDAVFRARGDARTPMWLLAGGLAFNAVLDPWLIFGGMGVPAMGVVGAGYATVATRLVAAGVGVAVLQRRGFLQWGPWRALLRGAEYVRLVRIGLPAAMGGVLYCATFLWLARLLTPFGEEALAAFAVGQKVESLSWAVLFGLGTVAAAWVGQNLGAGSSGRARRGTWAIVGAGVAVGSACTLLFVVMPEPLVAFFVPDGGGVADLGRLYLVIVGTSQVFLAVEIVLYQALLGSGDTVPPMVIVAVLTVARVPLAWWLVDGLDLGVAGIFWAVVISTVAKGIVLGLWFRGAAWSRRGAAITQGG